MPVYAIVAFHKRLQQKYRISVYFEAKEQALAFLNDIKDKYKAYKDFNVEESHVQYLTDVSYVDCFGQLIVEGVKTKYYYSKVG